MGFLGRRCCQAVGVLAIADGEAERVGTFHRHVDVTEAAGESGAGQYANSSSILRAVDRVYLVAVAEDSRILMVFSGLQSDVWSSGACDPAVSWSCLPLVVPKQRLVEHN